MSLTRSDIFIVPPIYKSIDVTKAGVILLPQNGLSDFGHFHSTFLGYTFLDKYNKVLLTKTQMFWAHKETCIKMKNTGFLDPQFRLIDSPGWKRGILMSVSNSN